MEKGPLIGRGRTGTEIFVWGDDRALKLFPDGSSADSVESEARSTRAVHEAGLPAPAVEGVVEVDGRQGIVLERVDGLHLGDALLAKPWKLFAAARMLAELQARVHSCEVMELPSLRDRLEERIRHGAALPEKMEEAVLRVLAELPEGNAVCHGDFHPGNIIMSSHGPVIVDWGDATRGNPLGEVARTWMLYRLASWPPDIPMRWLLNNLVRPLIHAIYLRRYLQLRPTSHEQMVAWRLPMVAARLAEDVSGERERFLAVIAGSL